jgi:hypothetical protein
VKRSVEERGGEYKIEAVTAVKFGTILMSRITEGRVKSLFAPLKRRT